METSIVTRKLTDDSEVFEVVAIDGSQRVVISANDADAAARIQECLDDDAAYITIESA